MRFFFYGTLIRGGCGDAVDAALGKLDAGVPAVARGRLYAVPDPDGWYPAFRPDPAGGPVHGVVFSPGAGFSAADLAAIDAYEDCRTADPDGSEYVRRPIPVTVRGGEIIVQAYLHRAPLPPGTRVIRGGDFLAFVAANRLPAYRSGRAQGADSGD